MSPSAIDQLTLGRRYALCVGIGTYTNLHNKDLRFAGDDARAIAKRLEGSLLDSFEVTRLTEDTQTSKVALDEAVEHLLSAPDRQAEDLAVIYFSCHGKFSAQENTFYLLPSDTAVQSDGEFEPNTIIGIADLARWFSQARTRNIVMLLDACHSGGAGAAVQHFKLNLSAGPNFFIIGGARQDQETRQSSQLGHGLFTHCLLRAFEQPPTKDGWLTISQIHTFVSEEISWFNRDHPIQIQGVSISVNPNLPLVRNPSYPELCPLPPIWQIPLQRNSFFTEQDDFLDRLAAMLQRDQKTALTQPQAISGLGGIGKTQLALEYAYRHRQDYHAVLWGRADTRETLISTFVTIAHLLDLPEKDEQEQMITVEAVKAWLAGRSKWLLILDNADELAMVKEFIPPAFQGHLLLTTRAQVMGGLARKIDVEAMRPETGALLLLRRAGLIAPDAPLEQASPADVTVAKELAEEMGGLPLALDQAGAYIEEASYSLQDYQRLYQTRRAELLKERGGVVSDYPESVATTWSLAFQKVEQDNPAASDLLRLCAFLHPDAIPEEVITKGAKHLGPPLQATASDPLALNKAITALRAYSLLHRDSASHTLTIHRLVQAVLKDGMDKQMQDNWIQRTIHVLNEAFPEVEFKNWTRCGRLLPHVLVCATWMEYELISTPAAYLFRKAGTYLKERGQYSVAEPLLARALSIYEQYLEDEYPNTAKSLNNLGKLYRRQGKYEEAELLYQRALAIQEQHLGTEHPSTASSLNDLAVLYYRQGKYEEAELLHKRVLAIRERHLGAEHPDTTDPLHGLAELYQHQGKYEEAELLYRRALSIRERHLGAGHPDIARSLNGLANLYWQQEKYEEAELLYKRALSIYERRLEVEHPDTAHPLHGLAELYQYQGKYGQAEPLYQRALAIHEKAYGPEHPNTAGSLNNLAELYHAQGKYEQAEPLYQRALTITEKQLEPEHPDTVTVRENYNALVRKMKREEKEQH